MFHDLQYRKGLTISAGIPEINITHRKIFCTTQWLHCTKLGRYSLKVTSTYQKVLAYRCTEYVEASYAPQTGYPTTLKSIKAVEVKNPSICRSYSESLPEPWLSIK